jgi:hypothetical protein
MKLNLLTVIAVAGVLAAGTALAQDNSGAGRRGQGRGYGGPAQSNEERAARQAACLEKNGGVCPNGGPRAECPGYGQGKGQGQGRGFCGGRGEGQGRGLRDGTGPRSVDGTCPLGNTPRQSGKRK